MSAFPLIIFQWAFPCNLHDVIVVSFYYQLIARFDLLFFEKEVIEIHQVHLRGNDIKKVENHSSR